MVLGNVNAALAANDTSEAYLNSPLPEAWAVPDSTAGPTVTSSQWWAGFGDELLDSLIAIGREANYDLATAVTRMDIARAQLGQARAAYFPNISLGVAYNRTRISGHTSAHAIPASTESYFSGQMSMSWEIDVFGKITAQVRAGKAQVRVSAAEYAATVNAIEAQIADTYIGLLAYRMQLEVAQRHAHAQSNILHAAEERFEAGLNSKLDVAQARTLYFSTIAQVPLLEASIEASINALAVLLGTTAEGLPLGVYQRRNLPDYHMYVDLGVPSELLKRRPDIIQAQAAVDAAAATLGVARREYLPSLSVQASAGAAAHRLGDLFSKPSFTYTIAPTLSWTVFDGLGRRYRNAEASGQLHAAVDAYNLTVLNAVEEVRDAATHYAASLRYIATVRKVVENAAESATLSFDLYRQGLTSFTTVDDAESSFLAYENTEVTAHSQALQALIALFKALGGAPLD